MMPFFCIHFSQGSVATCLKRGGIFEHEFVTNLLPSRLVKSDNIEVMAKSLVSCFFDSPCTTTAATAAATETASPEGSMQPTFVLGLQGW